EPAMSLPLTRSSAARRFAGALAVGALALALGGASSAVAAVCADCDPGGGGGTVIAPAAAFTATVTGRSVAFDGTGTTHSPTSETWNFGDGTSASNVLSTSHAYAHPGTFHVTLTASNSAGSNSVSHDVVIVNRLPSASFTVPTGAVAGEVVTFPASASDPDGTIDDYEWDYGDGSTSGPGFPPGQESY